MKAVGSLIKKAREKKGLSQTKAARALRFKEQFLGRVEAGKDPLPLQRAIKVSKSLGIYKAQLLDAYVTDYANKVNKVLFAQPKRR